MVLYVVRGLYLEVPEGCEAFEVIIDVRSALVEAGQVPNSIQKALREHVRPEEPLGPLPGEKGRMERKARHRDTPRERNPIEEASSHVLHSGLRSEVYGHTG